MSYIEIYGSENSRLTNDQRAGLFSFGVTQAFSCAAAALRAAGGLVCGEAPAQALSNAADWGLYGSLAQTSAFALLACAGHPSEEEGVSRLPEEFKESLTKQWRKTTAYLLAGAFSAVAICGVADYMANTNTAPKPKTADTFIPSAPN